jgi:DNA repair protein RadC
LVVRQLVITYAPIADPSAAQAIRTADDAAAILRERLADEPVEVFCVLCLTTKSDLIAYHEISRGSLNASIVHPREVFKPAVLSNAAAVIISHNHPSGDPTPSPEDLVITRRLREAGRLMGIEVVDHIVIGQQGRFYSYQQSGCL